MKKALEFKRKSNVKEPEVNGNKVEIFSNEKYTLKPGHRKPISTGLILDFPHSYIGLLKNHNEVSLKKGLIILSDIAEDGELEVNVANIGSSNIEIKKGMKIAEMIIRKVEKPVFLEKKSMNKTITSEDDDLNIIKKEIE